MSGKIKSIQPPQAIPNPSIVEPERREINQFVDNRQKQQEPQIKFVQSDINNSQFFNSKINGLSFKMYKHFDIQLPQSNIDLLESTYRQSQNLQNQNFQSQQIIQIKDFKESEFTIQRQCLLHQLELSKFCINKFCTQQSRIICQQCELEQLHNQDINANLESNMLFKIQIPQLLQNCQQQQQKIYDQCLLMTKQLTFDRLVEDIKELQVHLGQMKEQINLLEQRLIHKKYQEILENPDLLTRLHEDYLYKLFTHDPLKQIDFELEGYQESYQLLTNKLKQILENNNKLSNIQELKIQELKKEYQYQEKQIKLDNLCYYYKHQNYIASEVLLSENHNDKSQINYNLAYINYKQSKFKESLEYLEKVKQENKQYILATQYLKEGGVQDQQKQKLPLKQQIVAIFNNLIQIYPQFTKAQHLYSKFLYDTKQFNEADQVILKSVNLIHNPKYFQLKAQIDDTIGKDPKDTIKLYDKCLELDFTNILSYYKKGQLYIRLKQYEQALEMMNQVLIMDPRVWYALYYKCLIYGYYLSQFDKCLDCSNEGKLKFPQQKLFDKIYGILKDHKQKSIFQ